MARVARSLKVTVPKPGQDKPELGRVGVIAVAGFVIGVAWPWLAGVRLVPSPPSDETAEPLTSPAVPSVASGAPSGAAAASAPPAAASAAPARTTEETLKVSPMQVSACRDGKKKRKDCDCIGVDDRARVPLQALAACEDARGASETLSIGMEIDFGKKAVTDVFPGKSTTFPKDKAHALVDCVKPGLEGLSLDGVDHEHDRYTIFYFVEFVPPGTAVTAPAVAPEEATAGASGLATVGWDVAVVRDQPDDGKIIARIRYGTRVVVTARRGKWYEVKFDGKGTEGWVHGNALGL